MEITQVGEIMVHTLNQFSLASTEATRVADVFTGAYKTSAATVEKLAQGFTYAAPQMHALGFSVEESAAALSLFNDAGIEATRAGTGLRAIMGRLFTIAPRITRQFDRVGLSIANFRDQSGKAKSITEIFKTISEHTKDLTSTDLAAWVSKAFGIENAPAALLLIKSVKSMGKSVDDYKLGIQLASSASESYAIMLENTQGKLSILNSVFKNFSESIFKEIKPALDILIESLTSVIIKLSKFVENKSSWAVLLKSLVGIVALSTSIYVVWKSLVITFGALGMAFKFFTASAATTAATTTAVAAGSTAVAATTTAAATGVGFFSTALTVLRSAALPLLGVFGILTSVLNLVLTKDGFGEFSKNAKTGLDDTTATVETFGTKMENVFDSIKAGAYSMWDTIFSSENNTSYKEFLAKFKKDRVDKNKLDNTSVSGQKKALVPVTSEYSNSTLDEISSDYDKILKVLGKKKNILEMEDGIFISNNDNLQNTEAYGKRAAKVVNDYANYTVKEAQIRILQLRQDTKTNAENKAKNDKDIKILENNLNSRAKAFNRYKDLLDKKHTEDLADITKKTEIYKKQDALLVHREKTNSKFLTKEEKTLLILHKNKLKEQEHRRRIIMEDRKLLNETATLYEDYGNKKKPGVVKDVPKVTDIKKIEQQTAALKKRADVIEFGLKYTKQSSVLKKFEIEQAKTAAILAVEQDGLDKKRKTLNDAEIQQLQKRIDKVRALAQAQRDLFVQEQRKVNKQIVTKANAGTTIAKTRKKEGFVGSIASKIPAVIKQVGVLDKQLQDLVKTQQANKKTLDVSYSMGIPQIGEKIKELKTKLQKNKTEKTTDVADTEKLKNNLALYEGMLSTQKSINAVDKERKANQNLLTSMTSHEAGIQKTILKNKQNVAQTELEFGKAAATQQAQQLAYNLKLSKLDKQNSNASENRTKQIDEQIKQHKVIC